MASVESDAKLLADFDKSCPVTLVSLGSLESRLTDLIGVKVNLSFPCWMRESIRERVLK